MDQTPQPFHDPPLPAPARPRYRVPVGLPRNGEGRRAGALISVLLHAIIIGLLIVPFFMPGSVIERMQQGAGGAGPSGGGGGGSRGTGGRVVETLQFVKVTTQPVPTPTSIPVPAPVPPPLPVVQPPKPVVTPPVTAPEQPAHSTPAASTPAPAPGTGGGAGSDGSAGAGPGIGGGTGAGIGAGKGSANGPGSGGGTQANYAPVPIAFFLPPFPIPRSVRGVNFIAEFDVDSTGHVVDFTFTRTPDASYNRQIASTLRALRFRPGTRQDGTPIRMKAQITYGF